jgi:uncharacterized protein YdhG (YjbR/CyaY superfamily)
VPPKIKSMDDYLQTLPEDSRATLTRLRKSIKATAPEAVEGLSYGMASFKYRGRPLIYMAASKHHCALYGPAVVEFQDDLTGYDTSKGTIRFPRNKPLPAALVKKLVKARMKEIEAAEAKKKGRPTRQSR